MGQQCRSTCDMDRVCSCNGTGGWTHIAYLNMTDPNQQCPQAWREVSFPKRTCRRTSSRYESEYFSIYNNNYSQLHGKVIAYQYGSTDAFELYINRRAPPNTIVTDYIDGVSIPMGNLQDTIFRLLQVQSQRCLQVEPVIMISVLALTPDATGHTPLLPGQACIYINPCKNKVIWL